MIEGSEGLILDASRKGLVPKVTRILVVTCRKLSNIGGNISFCVE
jgi:hypothetical protein